MTLPDDPPCLLPGPFEVCGIEDVALPVGPHGSPTIQLNGHSGLNAPPAPCEFGEQVPVRNIDCPNYQSCLNLAAALDWESFSCAGCSGEINEALLWRAGQKALKDSVAKALCGETKVRMVWRNDE